MNTEYINVGENRRFAIVLLKVVLLMCHRHIILRDY